MLFATYGAPAPSGKNPLLIILGVCGGCVLIVVIGMVVMGVIGANMMKGIVGSAMETPNTTKRFVAAVESHNYTAAAAEVDPSAQGVVTAAKIQAAEEQVEKKLGPVQPGAMLTPQPASNQIPGPTGKPQFMEYVCTVPVRYKKGTANISVHFKSSDMSGITGMGDMGKIKIPSKLTSFTITPNMD